MMVTGENIATRRERDKGTGLDERWEEESEGGVGPIPGGRVMTEDPCPPHRVAARHISEFFAGIVATLLNWREPWLIMVESTSNMRRA